jgi:hypothetical protein
MGLGLGGGRGNVGSGVVGGGVDTLAGRCGVKDKLAVEGTRELVGQEISACNREVEERAYATRDMSNDRCFLCLLDFATGGGADGGDGNSSLSLSKSCWPCPSHSSSLISFAISITSKTIPSNFSKHPFSINGHSSLQPSTKMQVTVNAVISNVTISSKLGMAAALSRACMRGGRSSSS